MLVGPDQKYLNWIMMPDLQLLLQNEKQMKTRMDFRGCLEACGRNEQAYHEVIDEQQLEWRRQDSLRDLVDSIKFQTEEEF